MSELAISVCASVRKARQLKKDLTALVVTSGEDCARLDTGIELLLVSHFGRTCVSKLHPGRNDGIQKLSRSASSWTRHHIEVPRQSNAVLQSQQQEDGPSSHVCDVQRQLLNPRSSQSGSQDVVRRRVLTWRLPEAPAVRYRFAWHCIGCRFP